jgi:hypothetical protein
MENLFFLFKRKDTFVGDLHDVALKYIRIDME